MIDAEVRARSGQWLVVSEASRASRGLGARVHLRRPGAGRERRPGCGGAGGSSSGQGRWPRPALSHVLVAMGSADGGLSSLEI